jgi:hypothetical protein
MLKRGLLALTSLLALLVPARAQELDVAGAEPLLRVFAAVFDKPYTPEIIILSFAMMIVFTILLTVLLMKTKIFEGFQPAAGLVGGIFAFLAIRYTPLGFFFFILIAVIILTAGAFIFLMYDAVKKGMGISGKIGLMFMAIGCFVIGGLLLFASEKLADSGIEIPAWSGGLAWFCIILGIFMSIGMVVTLFGKVKWPGTAGGPTWKQSGFIPRKFGGGKVMTQVTEELAQAIRDLEYERRILFDARADIAAARQARFSMASVRAVINRVTAADRDERRGARLAISVQRILLDVRNRWNILVNKEKVPFRQGSLGALNAAIAAARTLRQEEGTFIHRIEEIERLLTGGQWQANRASVDRWLAYLEGYINREIAVATYTERLVRTLERHSAAQRS